MSAATLAPPVTGEARIAALIDRVALVRPAQAERARAELDVSLAALRGSATGGLAWESSCLTPCRYPVEVAVTSAADELRTVVDVLAPEDDRRAALDAAGEIARAFGSPGLAGGVAALLRRHQRGFAPRWGAWLGSRHTAGATRHKLYVELDPRGSREVVEALAPEARRVLGGAGPVRFLGVGLDEHPAVELYARPPHTDGDLLRVLAARAGAPELAERLARATVGDGSGEGRNHAVSVAAADGRVTAVAAFTFARQRLGRDHRVREHVLRRARADGWACAEFYAAASAPLGPPTPMVRPFHTALSEVAAVGAPGIVHHVGLAPPPLPHHPDEAHPTPDRGERS